MNNYFVLFTAITIAAQAWSDQTKTIKADNDNAIDVYVMESEPDRSIDHGPGDHGVDAVIESDPLDQGGRVHGLFAFKNIFGEGPDQISTESIIKKATLRFWYVNDNRGREVEIYRMNEPWDESSTWESLGGGIGANDNATLSQTVTFGSEIPSSVEIDVTEDLTIWSVGSPNYGWGIVTPQDKDGIQLASSEATTGDGDWHTPTLTIEYMIAETAVANTASATEDGPKKTKLIIALGVIVAAGASLGFRFLKK